MNLRTKYPEPSYRLDAIIGAVAVAFALLATLGWLVPLVMRGLW